MELTILVMHFPYLEKIAAILDDIVVKVWP